MGDHQEYNKLHIAPYNNSVKNIYPCDSTTGNGLAIEIMALSGLGKTSYIIAQLQKSVV